MKFEFCTCCERSQQVKTDNFGDLIKTLKPCRKWVYFRNKSINDIMDLYPCLFYFPFQTFIWDDFCINTATKIFVYKRTLQEESLYKHSMQYILCIDVKRNRVTRPTRLYFMLNSTNIATLRFGFNINFLAQFFERTQKVVLRIFIVCLSVS